MLTGLSNLIKKAFSLVFNHRYHLDDILIIVRPFVYLFCICKFGRKSTTPIKVSALLDLIALMLSFSRVMQAQ